MVGFLAASWASSAPVELTRDSSRAAIAGARIDNRGLINLCDEGAAEGLWCGLPIAGFAPFLEGEASIAVGVASGVVGAGVDPSVFANVLAAAVFVVEIVGSGSLASDFSEALFSEGDVVALVKANSGSVPVTAGKVPEAGAGNAGISCLDTCAEGSGVPWSLEGDVWASAVRFRGEAELRLCPGETGLAGAPISSSEGEDAMDNGEVCLDGEDDAATTEVPFPFA